MNKFFRIIFIATLAGISIITAGAAMTSAPYEVLQPAGELLLTKGVWLLISASILAIIYAVFSESKNTRGVD